MWNDKRVSVVLMTYTEKESIRRVIEGFFATGVVDEVLVVNNNAEPGTEEEVAATPARQIFESRQGYGYAMHRGLREAKGDLVVVAEPDGTFLPEDIRKLLVYSDECDAVFATRTTSELVWRGANMGSLIRWGNWGVAKLIEVLFNTSHLSDVGCTYRLLSKNLIKRLLPRLRVGGSHASPEVLLCAIEAGARFVEVPVNYLPRVGHSTITGSNWGTFTVGVRMVALILRFRLRLRRRLPRPGALSTEGRGEAGAGR